ncbi:gas vesicle protein GvpL [Halomarina pelagica]|uniref:gas vesicle protein GvpL n=1 Tax=Halomarina pelagica TaxID=2961599 RepID=UPI0020C3E270|nr:GvpL/GvpF family gas vesicle protein [Halomarina sp. BND7]
MREGTAEEAAHESGGGSDSDSHSRSHPLDEGRYLYCAVRTGDDGRGEDEGNGGDGADGGGRSPLDASGIDDEPVFLIETDGVGFVVHERAEPYDADDPTLVRRWLLAHQRVIDAAGERFGTPIPFRFDTLARGDDDGVRELIDERREAFVDALDDLRGHWEYRIEVVSDPEAVEAAVLDEDDDLAALRERVEGAEGGTRHLLEKQYEQRLARARRARGGDRTDALAARLDDHAREVRALPRDRQTAGLVERDDGDTLARLAVLASEAGADAIGGVLDDVAVEPGVEVRYTGPWPPYTFAPSLEEDDDGAA